MIRTPRKGRSPWWLFLLAIPVVIAWFAAVVALQTGIDR